jgi:hypothetical protein
MFKNVIFISKKTHNIFVSNIIQLMNRMSGRQPMFILNSSRIHQRTVYENNLGIDCLGSDTHS